MSCVDVIGHRVGRRNGHTLYLYAGAATDTDLFVGSCVSPALARAVAFYANLGLAHTRVTGRPGWAPATMDEYWAGQR